MAENIRETIRPHVMKAAKELVARKMIENWNYLQLAMASANPPVTLPNTPPTPEQLMGNPNGATQEERDGIAGSLIRNRSAMIPGANGAAPVELRLADVDTAIDQATTRNPQLRTMLGGIGRVDELIPTTAALDEITNATARGVEKETGFGNKIMTFLKGLGKWIMSMFSGEKLSFSQAMAEAAAPGVRDSVRGELQAISRDPNNPASRLLNLQNADGTTPIDAIGRVAFEQTYTQLGATPPPPPSNQLPPPPLDQVRPSQSGVDLGAMSTNIRGAILNPPGGAPLGNMIYDQLATIRETKRAELTSGRMGNYNPLLLALPSDETLRTTSNNMANTIATTVSARLTDPNFRTQDGKRLSELSKEQFSQVMANEVGNALLDAERRGEIDFGRFGAGAYGTDRPTLSTVINGKSVLDTIKAQVATQVSERYTLMAPVANLVANTQAQPAPAPAPATPAFDTIVSRTPIRGVNGGHHLSNDNLSNLSPLGGQGAGAVREIV